MRQKRDGDALPAESVINGVDAKAPELEPTLSVWLFAEEVKRVFGRSIRWVEEQVVNHRVRTSEMRGVLRYHKDDIASLVNEETSEKAHADALRTATSLAAQAEGTLTKVLTMLLDNNGKLYDRMHEEISSARDYIEKLEASNMAQRAAAENALSLEQSRVLERQKAEHDMALRERVVKSLSDFGLPIVFGRLRKKWDLGDDAPPAPSSSGNIPDAMKVSMADAFLNWLQTLPGETLSKLKDVLPPGHFDMLSSVYEKVKP